MAATGGARSSARTVPQTEVVDVTDVNEQLRLEDAQFADQQSAEYGSLDLSRELDLWEEDGTFEFPPHPADAQHLVRFWTLVDISDDIMVTANNLYSQRRFDEAADIARQWRVSNPRSRSGLDEAQYTAKVAAYVEAQMVERDKVYPPVMPRTWVRGIVRTAKMDEAASLLAPEEAQKVRDLTVRMPGDYRLTIAQIVETYRTRELLPNLTDLRRRDEVADIIDRNIAKNWPV